MSIPTYPIYPPPHCPCNGGGGGSMFPGFPGYPGSGCPPQVSVYYPEQQCWFIPPALPCPCNGGGGKKRHHCKKHKSDEHKKHHHHKDGEKKKHCEKKKKHHHHCDDDCADDGAIEIVIINGSGCNNGGGGGGGAQACGCAALLQTMNLILSNFNLGIIPTPTQLAQLQQQATAYVYCRVQGGQGMSPDVAAVSSLLTYLAVPGATFDAGAAQLTAVAINALNSVCLLM